MGVRGFFFGLVSVGFFLAFLFFFLNLVIISWSIF